MIVQYAIHELTAAEVLERLHANGCSIGQSALYQGVRCGALPFGVCIDMGGERDKFLFFEAPLERWITERLSREEFECGEEV